jgi:glycosyltransferase involved in cell wall biosynthesis
MRVALLSAPPVANHGWGRYTRDLIGGLAAQNVEVVLITSPDAPDDPGLPLVAYHRILPSFITPKRGMSLRLLAAIPAVMRATAGCDIVHVIVEPYILSVPHRAVVTAHGTYIPRTVERPLFGALYRRAYRRARVICVSGYTQQQVQIAVPGVHSTVIPNGVNFERYQQPGTPPLKGGPTVLAVGQVKPRKGYHILAQAMGAVRQAIPDVQAVFIGDLSESSYVDTIKAQLERDGLTDTVHLLGRVPDDVLFGWYHAADVFALPSLNVGKQFEGFGLAYLEANAAGLPAIGTLNCGAEEAIRDGETGYLIPQNDVAATAEAIIRLLKDDTLRKKMGATAQLHAQGLGWDEIARRTIEVYRA